MEFILRTTTVAFGALCFFAAVQAFAAEGDGPAAPPPDHAIELGVGIGQSQLRVSSPDFSGSDSIHATAYKAFVGYRFSKYLAVEAAYIDGGTFTEGNTADGRIDLHPRMEQLSVVGAYPVLQYLSIYGRVGADHWDSHLTLSVPEGKAVLSGSDTNFAWGAGLQTYFDRALLRVEYEQMRTSQNLAGVLPADFRHQMISLSLVWLL